MQSAFVDLGLERDGFLYVTDVVATLRGVRPPRDRRRRAAFAGAARRPRPAMAGKRGSRSGRRTRRRRPAAVGPRRRRDRDREKGPEPKIEELLKEGQEIIVQVAKEPLGTKGARLTSHATMPGRFLVFMPTVDHVGVSRKIESREERAACAASSASSASSTASPAA